MGFFTKLGDKEKEIERGLKSIAFYENIQLPYTKDKNEKVNSPVYLLPLETQGGKILGRFKMDDELVEAEVGFSHKPSFLFKDHYLLNSEGDLEKRKWFLSSMLYLPLKVSEFSKESFKVLGVNGVRGIYPLILLSETDRGTVLRGLYKSGSGVKSYLEQIEKTGSNYLETDRKSVV